MNTTDIITESLRHYGFGAAIEVTNAIKNSSYSKKAGQISMAKKYLDGLTRGKVKVATGLAFGYMVNHTTERRSKKANVMINVHRYEPEKLECILTDMIDTSFLSQEQGEMVEKILAKTNPCWTVDDFLDINDLKLKRSAKYLDMSSTKYMAHLGNIRGFVLELYVQSMFEEELSEKQIFYRHQFKNKMKKNKKSDIDGEVDIIIACGQEEFYNAVQRMDNEKDTLTQLVTKKI